MTAMERSRLRRILHGRCDAIAEAWHRVIGEDALAGRSPVAVRRFLSELVERTITLLLADLFNRGEAKAIGAEFVRFHSLQPEALARIQEVFVQKLVEGLSPEQIAALHPRLGALLGLSAAGFSQQIQEKILKRQERIRTAYVGEMRRMRQALRIKDAAMDSAVIAIALCNLEGKLTYVNQTFLIKWGYDNLWEVVGRDATDFWQSPDQASAVLQTVEEKGGWIGKLAAKKKDGSLFKVLIAADTVEGEAGRPVRMAASFIDVTLSEQLQDRLWQHVDRLETLHDIDRTILAAKSSREIAQAALSGIRQLVPCQRASVLLFDLEVDQALLLAGQPDIGMTEEMGHLSLEGFQEEMEALREGEIVSIEDVTRFPLPGPMVQALETAELRSYAIVPIACRDELIGSLNLAVESPAAFDYEHESIAQEVASSLAIAVRQARLFESVREQRERLRALATRLAEIEEAERRRLAGCTIRWVRS